MNADMKMTQEEHTQHNLNIFVRVLLMYSIVVLAFYGYVPIWAIVVCNIALYFSVYVSVHEIGHSLKSDKFSLVARMVPLATPIWGGTRVFQNTHYRHHVYFATDRDPWLNYYGGHPLKALFFNLIEPENNLYNFIKDQGVDRELILNLVYNLLFLGVNIVAFQKYYLVLFLSQRIIHGVTVFFFNFFLHRSHLSADADYSVYEKSEMVKPFLPIVTLIWGQGVSNGFMYHNRHHCMGQWHVQTQHYELIEDTGSYSPYIKEWPIKSIKTLETSGS